MENDIENLKSEIKILKGIIGKLLVIINRLLLDDDAENILRIAALLVEYPVREK